MSQTKPWALSPLISTMPHFAHKRLLPTCGVGDISIPPFPTTESVKESTEDLHLTVIDYHSNSPASSSPSSQSSNEPTPASSSLSLASTSSLISTRSSKNTGSFKIRSPMIKGKQKRRLTVEEDIQHLHGASERRSFFSIEKNRKSIVFGPEVSFLL